MRWPIWPWVLIDGGDFGDRELLDDLGESYGVRVGDPGLLLF